LCNTLDGRSGAGPQPSGQKLSSALNVATLFAWPRIDQASTLSAA
jgi:hypothetical protein